jgi:RHS repeat-associated protein
MSEQLGSNYYNTPYKFNGKELDEETGLYYYGARYYDPRVSIWLSVDPLAESYPDCNPYNYCIQNPINVIDPTGMSPEGPGDPPPTELNEVVIVNSYKKPMSSVKSSINDFSKSGLVFIMNMAATHANNNLSFGIASLPSKPEDFGEYELSARLGRLAGDAAAILQGLSEDSVAGSAEVVTIGVATIPAVGLAIHGTAVAVAGTAGAGSEISGLVNYFAKGKGERGQTRKADGTDNPFKKLRDDPNKPGNVLEKNSHTGKVVSKPAPPGYKPKK